ncbi:MAG: Maf family nucleotide pyrophosphatase [Bacteroidota bacterium]
MLLQEKIKPFQVFLCSGSPRRHQLLKEIGIPFKIMKDIPFDESYPSTMDAYKVPVYLAENKSGQVEINDSEHKNIILTADTVVILNNSIINKPVDREDAIKMLQRLSGNKHEVVTGVCLKKSSGSISFSVLTEVYFKTLTNEEIEYYIDQYKPYDKAGSYGIQEWIGYIGIDKINGSFYNVMGLPVEKLYTELEQFIL